MLKLYVNNVNLIVNMVKIKEKLHKEPGLDRIDYK